MISRDAWLQALADVAPKPDTDPSVVTMKEFAAMVGLGRTQATERMNQLLKAGLAVRAIKRVAKHPAGIYPAAAYRLITPTTKRRR